VLPQKRRNNRTLFEWTDDLTGLAFRNAQGDRTQSRKCTRLDRHAEASAQGWCRASGVLKAHNQAVPLAEFSIEVRHSNAGAKSPVIHRRRVPLASDSSPEEDSFQSKETVLLP